MERDIELLRKHVAELSDQLVQSRRRIAWMEQTRSWALTRPLRAATEWGRQLRERFGRGEAPAPRRVPIREVDPQARGAFEAELEAILQRHAGQRVLVAYATSERVRRIAAESGCLCFLVDVDRSRGFEELAPRVYLTGQPELLDRAREKREKIVYVSEDSEHPLQQLESWRARGDRILYDYGGELREERLVTQRHYALIADEAVACLTSTQARYDDVAQVRRKNVALVETPSAKVRELLDSAFGAA